MSRAVGPSDQLVVRMTVRNRGDRAATLADVVERYNDGVIVNPYLDREIRPLNLSDQQKRDLVAFLESLTGNIRFRDAGNEAERASVSNR